MPNETLNSKDYHRKIWDYVWIGAFLEVLALLTKQEDYIKDLATYSNSFPTILEYCYHDSLNCRHDFSLTEPRQPLTGWSLLKRLGVNWLALSQSGLPPTTARLRRNSS